MTAPRSISEQFGPAAAEYASFSYHVSGPDLEPMVGAGALSGTERVLDVGCGAGHAALWFAPRARDVVALDPTEPMLEQCRRLAAERGLANVHTRRGDAERLPFPDASFDRVISRQSAHHWKDVRAALGEFSRVLNAEGHVVLVDTFAPEDPQQDAFLNRIELLRDSTHVRDYRVSEWKQIFAESGFTLEHRQNWGIALDFEDWVQRSRTGPAEIAKLREAFACASQATRTAFAIQPNCDWSIPVGLVVGRR